MASVKMLVTSPFQRDPKRLAEIEQRHGIFEHFDHLPLLESPSDSFA